MAVVINEFEIIAEPPAPPKQEEAEPKAAEGHGSQPLSPHDLSTVIRHERERHARYWAH
jgi:hypothetical protein